MLIATVPDSQAHLDTVLTLPRETDAYAIARACREAGMAFLNESEFWGKAELAMWLLGPYAQVTQYVKPDSSRRREAPPLPLLREIDATTIERLMRTTRAEVRATLEKLFEAEGAASFAFSMLASGFVIRCEDTLDVGGWAPTREASRLTDRVLSLFAADYLTRPGDYELDFAVCELCRTVEFDASTRMRGVCDRHGVRGSGAWGRAPFSTVAPPHLRKTEYATAGVRSERATLPYLQELKEAG
jgi:hypothetical protein